jgi:Domain of unknown function (DUF1998)
MYARLHARLEETGAAFRFSFGQYTGATPEHRNDSYRHASDVIAHRFPGELVLRDEMRSTPPHILLTNFSMLEYQLLRPDDSPLFDEAHGQTWRFLVLDEAHQYRSTRGAEMSLLLRRLKQRLRRSGNSHSFRCIATSASLAGDDADRAAVAAFATTLFDEPFEAEDVILAKTEDVPSTARRAIRGDAYPILCDAISKDDPAALSEFEESASTDDSGLGSRTVAARVGRILAQDPRTKALREYMGSGPRAVSEVADGVFPEIAQARRIGALTALADVLNRAEQPQAGGPFLSVRYHVFLRALEGAFIRYAPEREITLAPQTDKEAGGLSFELALCRECGQHYLVGRKVNGFLAEAVSDPSRDDFGVSFFLPVANWPVPGSDDTWLFTTRPYFLHAAGAGRGEIHFDGTSGALVTIRKAIPGRMAVLSEGRRARQFYICNGCGAGFIEPQATHKSPWNSECKAKLSRVSLGHEFVTDVVQVDFHLSPPPLMDLTGDYSGLGLGIATALLEGMAEVVDVSSSDLSVTIGRGGSAGLPIIVLYDAVPGGAGLVARIEDANVFRMSLEAAFRRVEGGCECGEDASCYGCLRSYRNQFAHPQLKRGPVKSYIGEVLRHWKV